MAEGGLLLPSLRWCKQHLGWWPGIVVADMGYLSAASKEAARVGWQSAVIPKLRADMKLVPPYVSAREMHCPQGQLLEWWEYEAASGTQWFRVTARAEHCAWCWEASSCPRHFGYAAGAHETLLGLIPLGSRMAARLLRQVRPWIEPAQSFEKNQLGLGRMFLNSLRLTWQMSLLADSAVLLRTKNRIAKIHDKAGDNRPLLAAGQPELREHKAVYVQSDEEVGLFSDEVMVNCAP